MNGSVSNLQTRQFHPEPAEASQEKPLSAVASTGTGLPRSLREQSPASGGLAQDEPQSTKRQLDKTPETHPVPAAKRPRLENTEAQQPRVEDEEPEQPTKVYQRFLTHANQSLLEKVNLQQPTPKPPKRAVSFLENCVDPVDPIHPPEPINTFISEWLESFGSDQDKRCRSDSHLRHSDDGSISRKLTRSAPEMAYTRDADGFAVPPKPNSYTGSVAPSDLTGATPDSARSSGRSLVEDPLYRSLNLASNNIYMCSLREQFPEHIADLVDHVRRDRDSPSPSPDQVRQDTALEALEMGTGEPDVEEYFRNNIYPYPNSTEKLKRSDRQPMSKHAVPNAGSKLRVGNPVPDMLYGYNRHGAFPQQQAQLISMGDTVVANAEDLIYPFFVIEFKGDGPGGGGTIWVATNQCLGGSASCVNIAERLNRQLTHCKNDKIGPINSAAFGIAMSGTEARLYISWKHDEFDYYTRKIKSFLLQEPEHYIEFRKYVRNIIDWGKDRRLKEIQDALNTLLEESRKRASEAAESRQPPSDGSATSRDKRHKSSSSRRNSSRSDNGQGQCREGDKPYWNWDEAAGQWCHTNPDGTVIWAEQEGQLLSAE